MTTATATPALSTFRASHPDVATWSTFDFEVYERLMEAARSLPPDSFAADVDGLSSAGLAALTRLLQATPYLEADSEFNYVIGYDLDRAAA